MGDMITGNAECLGNWHPGMETLFFSSCSGSVQHLQTDRHFSYLNTDPTCLPLPSSVYFYRLTTLNSTSIYVSKPSQFPIPNLSFLVTEMTGSNFNRVEFLYLTIQQTDSVQ